MISPRDKVDYRWLRNLTPSAVVSDQAFRQGDQFGLTAVWLPRHTPVCELPDNHTASRTAQGFYPVARLEGGALPETLDNLDHRFPVQHAGDAVGDRRRGFASPRRREIGEKRGRNLPANLGKSVPVKEKKGGAAMAAAEELYRFAEGVGLPGVSSPVAGDRCLSFWIKTVLRLTSLARCSVEADDKLPTPVFEKLGSGL